MHTLDAAELGGLGLGGLGLGGLGLGGLGLGGLGMGGLGLGGLGPGEALHAETPLVQHLAANSPSPTDRGFVMTVESVDGSSIGVSQIEVVQAATGMIEDGKLDAAPRKAIAQVGGFGSPSEDTNLLFGMKSLFAQMFGSCNSASHGLTCEAQH